MAMFSDSQKEFSAADIPSPEILDPAAVPSLRWGFIGAGDIAEVMATTLALHTRQRVVAVASRTPGKAKAFAERHSIEAWHASYEELVARPDVDVVYVAMLPHNHLEHSLLAIAAGKHVLVEKPLTLSTADADTLYAAARAAGVFAMEAMWTRYLPQASIIRQLLAANTLGEIRLLQADFGQDNRLIERLWLPNASIVMDMAIYPISFAQQILGSPTKITAVGQMHNEHVEALAVAVLEYASGARAVLTTTAYSHVPTRASISGDQGVLTVEGPFFVPSGLGLHAPVFNGQGPSWRDETGVVGHEGLCYQANHLAKYVADGLLESPLHTHADSIEGIRIGEEIRRQIGVPGL